MRAGTNFDYLKNVDKNLYEIITEAENLYREEFFEQCITQTRRFGEHICRKVLGKSRTTEITFDEMLSTLRDKIHGYEQEKEFIDDLYFLKKNGNEAVHASVVKKSATIALECLQRAFEAGINYAVYNKKANSDILKLQYDIDLLVTGKRTKKSLSQRYSEEKAKLTKKTAPKKKKIPVQKTKTTKKQVTSMNTIPRKNGISAFWIVVGISLIIALCTVIFIML